jgi:hypothetical protein
VNVPQASVGGKMWIRQQTRVRLIGAVMILALMSVCGNAAFAAVTASPNSLRFPNQTVGTTSAPIPVTVSNTSPGSITIVSATTSATQFSYSGPAMPLNLGPGQSFTASVTFTPSATQNYNATLLFKRRTGPKLVSINLSGTGMQGLVAMPSLTASGSAMTFSAVAGGAAPATQSLTIGANPASAVAFTATADQAWMTLGAKSGTTPSAIQVGANISGLAAGNYTGHVIVTASGVTNSPMSIAVTLSVTAPQTHALTAAPSSLAFSAVAGGTAPATQSLTIGENPSGTVAYAVSADQAWVALSAGSGTSSSAIQVGANTSGLAAGNYAGHVIVTAAGVTNSPMSVTVTLAVTAAQTNLLSVSPTSLAFGNINVGNNNPKTVTVTNSGTGSVTISSVAVVGAGLSANGIATPMTLTAGQATVLSVVFAPTVVGAVNGTVSVTSNATNSPSVISATGTGVQPSLAASPSTLNFGSVVTGSSASQTITISNTGSAAATISQAVIAGTGYTMSGIAIPTTLAAGASTSFSVQFAPTVAATDAGSVTVTSNTPNSPTLVALNGTATATVAHSVTLSWVASTSTVVGYNIYRGSVSGGPYALLNSTPSSSLMYTDMAVTAGQTYFYVVTAVDSSGNESVVSNEVSVTIPTP